MVSQDFSLENYWEFRGVPFVVKQKENSESSWIADVPLYLTVRKLLLLSRLCIC